MVDNTEQEPVAYRYDQTHVFLQNIKPTFRTAEDRVVNGPTSWVEVPLYAAPIRTKDLTDDEIHKCMNGNFYNALDFARAVIAADREKNK